MAVTACYLTHVRCSLDGTACYLSHVRCSPDVTGDGSCGLQQLKHRYSMEQLDVKSLMYYCKYPKIPKNCISLSKKLAPTLIVHALKFCQIQYNHAHIPIITHFQGHRR